MKFLPLLALFFSLPVFADGRAVVPVVPLLSWSYSAAPTTPRVLNTGCQIYATGTVHTTSGRPDWHKSLAFTADVPNVARLKSLLLSVRFGEMVSTRGTGPNSGTAEYRALYQGNTLLRRDAFPLGSRSTSPAAAPLIRFVDLNCR